MKTVAGMFVAMLFVGISSTQSLDSSRAFREFVSMSHNQRTQQQIFPNIPANTRRNRDPNIGGKFFNTFQNDRSIVQNNPR
jgi:hypothetical protein